jgi:hypothetical protein
MSIFIKIDICCREISPQITQIGTDYKKNPGNRENYVKRIEENNGAYRPLPCPGSRGGRLCLIKILACPQRQSSDYFHSSFEKKRSIIIIFDQKIFK